LSSPFGARFRAATTLRAIERSPRQSATPRAQWGYHTKINVLEIKAGIADEYMSQNERPKSATFSPTEKSFQAIHTDYGVFLVSLQNVTQYANGYKAVFHLGNPMSLTFRNVDLELKWGPERPKDGFGKAVFRTPTGQKISHLEAEHHQGCESRKLESGGSNPCAGVA